MEQCRICDGPLHEGFIVVVDAGMRWLDADDLGRDHGPDAAGPEELEGVAATRCPTCRVGVFDYDRDQLTPAVLADSRGWHES